MSATRDKSQKITFVYSNLYSIYRKGVERAREGAARESDKSQPSLASEALAHVALGRPVGSGAVLKSENLKNPARRVTSYTPAELIGKRVSKPAVLSQAPEAASQPASPIESLKQNLQSLNDLQARLRFMLKELEELIKD